VTVCRINGWDVDLKPPAAFSRIDVILGGHTHDAIAADARNQCRLAPRLVTNAGSERKIPGVLILEIAKAGSAMSATGCSRGLGIAEPDPSMQR